MRDSEQIAMTRLPGAQDLHVRCRAHASLLLWSWEHGLERLWTFAQTPGLSAHGNLQHMVSSLPESSMVSVSELKSLYLPCSETALGDGFSPEAFRAAAL